MDGKLTQVSDLESSVTGTLRVRRQELRILLHEDVALRKVVKDKPTVWHQPRRYRTQPAKLRIFTPPRYRYRKRRWH